MAEYLQHSNEVTTPQPTTVNAALASTDACLWLQRPRHAVPPLPAQASLTCEVTGPVSFRQGDPAKLGGTEGSEVFSEQKVSGHFPLGMGRRHRGWVWGDAGD